ncbi:hypothetical protein CC1G_12140 [Coprinopsis cinerea okayama7|uniref:Uncharacterized protein n=1 Tax=Coprinopsis cinerea (strain Okayama-7 / 130 / ATCC MYA-4618 / FGSC 9003) TaxID=240176 RepID=A8P6X8_COPC7|nr:hypothetical protein CC1G_12140 [Coprinopsis cinerea okayama7\|eukprot:XP_001839249.1 hypothetical protein CC1G_12140 [Coprinopsis cinerea okayama7\
MASTTRTPSTLFHRLSFVLYGYFFLVLVSEAFVGVRASRYPGWKEKNITVEENDPRIWYSPGWERMTVYDERDHGGYHMLSSYDNNAYATFRFNGTAFYYLSAKWPHRVAATLSLDGGPPIQVDLQDHYSPWDEGARPTIWCDVVASQTNLDPDYEHELRVYSRPGEPYLVLDAIMYTALERSTSEPEVLPPIPGDDGGNMLAMALGIGIGVGACLILILIFVLIWLKRRRQERMRKRQIIDFAPHRTFDPSPTSSRIIDKPDIEESLPSPWATGRIPGFVMHQPQRSESLDSMYSSRTGVSGTPSPIAGGVRERMDITLPVNPLPALLSNPPPPVSLRPATGSPAPQIRQVRVSHPTLTSTGLPPTPTSSSPSPPGPAPASTTTIVDEPVPMRLYDDSPPAYPFSHLSRMSRQTAAPRYSTVEAEAPPVPRRSSTAKPKPVVLTHERPRRNGNRDAGPSQYFGSPPRDGLVNSVTPHGDGM